LQLSTGFRAFGLASFIALATIVSQAVPAAAVDPSPSPSASVDPSASPTATPDPAASPAPTPDPASASPAPTADPSASASPDPSIAPAPATDPAASATPAPTTDPAATTAATTAVTTSVAARVVPPGYRPRIVQLALRQRGKRYRSGSEGPWAFDCSGLVRYVYNHVGVGRRLGGGSSARGMYYWARLHHLASRSNPRIGDVVVYGHGSHVGIYIGNGRVLSALNWSQGIRVTGLHALRAPFTTFIHARI
jgi:cell wall-associated NlpC family hydrolase